MANVKVVAPTNDPTEQSEALAGSISDAGNKGLDHYLRRLPRWRHRVRQSLLPVVRWETPHLARIQQSCRTDFLDSYFAMTANLGTHTFFMTALPICFWCGYTGVGRALVHMLALGVYWSGFLKDMLCLPRPLSPPLTRITMSGSAALEYGFPSTHSTNAVSVAAYFLFRLHASPDDLAPAHRSLFLFMGYFYATSIILGRMYCGMHGFFDVVVGSVLGLILAICQLAYGEVFDEWVSGGSWLRPLLLVGAILLAVRFHPEPADNCPCYDDSVAFAGVIAGVEVAHWHYAQTSYPDPTQPPSTVYYSLEQLGWTKTVIRVAGGIVVIFVWRAAMKPTLLRCLPPVFRFVETLGLTLPRRYFTRASKYKRVPPLRKDDNVIPSAKEIPEMLNSLRHPRKRGISIGPQSEADAREFIAYREKRRRDSRSSADGMPMSPRPLRAERVEGGSSASGYFSPPTPTAEEEPFPVLETPPVKPVASLRPGNFPAQPLTPPASDCGHAHDLNGTEEEEEKLSDQAMFLALEKPRVRYDVEVVTKLVVYAGIAWLAVEGNPVLFQLLGLGMVRS
ncbi:hypothetical protein AAFC00_006851 [Neodothiora populina]|uniref:Phosphatidic acid phosphatase type 2/haloperoxidase domain-containing protein n=1 Tax=Neodothiora populina TaxID=2781224 RepID=A0ABR3PBL5_9PEZI